jgi:hypothetical protein
MPAALLAAIVLLPLAAVAAVAYWRAKRLLAGAPCRTRRYLANALGVGLLLPAALFAWNTLQLVTRYAPDRCGSWWLGASETTCTLGFYVASRTLAALIFVLGPVTALCLAVSFGVFWIVRTRTVHR